MPEHAKVTALKQRLNKNRHPYREVVRKTPRSPKENWIIEIFTEATLIGTGSHRNRTRALLRAVDAADAWCDQTFWHERKNASGTAGHERGQRNERRLLTLLTAPPFPLPDWITGARLATPEEDSHGIDVVVTTDAGTFYFQVKSSFQEKAKFLAKGRCSTYLNIIVIHEFFSDEVITKNALTFLQSCYDYARDRRSVPPST